MQLDFEYMDMDAIRGRYFLKMIFTKLKQKKNYIVLLEKKQINIVICIRRSCLCYL